MNLKTIEEHNELVFKKNIDKYSTGVQCPNCVNELKYINDIMLLSNPPQKEVKCFNCNYTTRIFV
jgi:ribosomal protein S27E